jgi:hypothetical protein
MLERQLRDRRDDVELWQVYADHLATIDPALSQWLALHLAKERGAQVNAEIGELYIEIMGGGLITLLMPAAKNYASRARLGYLHGFIDLAEIDLVLEDNPADPFLPVRHLFAMRASGFLRRLELKLVGSTQSCVDDALLALAAHAMPSLDVLNVRLEQVELTGEDDEVLAPPAPEPFAISEATRVSVFRAAPHLQNIHIRSELGRLDYHR